MCLMTLSSGHRGDRKDTTGQEPGDAQVPNLKLSNLFTCNFPDAMNCSFPIFTLPTKRKSNSDVSENNMVSGFWFFPSAK